VKTCTRCNIEQDDSDFTKHPKTRDGLNCWCKTCVSELNRRRYKPTYGNYLASGEAKKRTIHQNIVVQYGEAVAEVLDDVPAVFEIEERF
jgi:hypothetical protein